MKYKYNIVHDFVTTLQNLTHLILGAKKLNGGDYYLTLNGVSLNLIINKEEMWRQLEKYSLGEDDLINEMANSIYQIYKSRMEHDDREWDSFHDTLFQATNKDYSRPELENIFCFVIPSNLRDASYHWGMSDTPWRDDAYEWAYNNLEILKTI
jgi:hypothetical protein